MFDPAKFKNKVMASAGKKRPVGKPVKKDIPLTSGSPVKSPNSIQVRKVPESLSLPPMREIEEFSPNDLIVDSRFCMGCFRSCADYLGTNMEIWWCRRDPDEVGDIEFVLVKKIFKVSQCKWRMDKWQSVVPF